MRKDFLKNCDILRLEYLLSVEKDLSRYKRIQCVYLRAKMGLKAPEIGMIVGYSIASVWSIHGLYKKKGEEAFDLKGKGGRYHQNLSLDEEKGLIDSFIENGSNGGILEVSKIQEAYEEKLDRKIHKSCIYRALHRHGWRKIAPRKKHPKNDKEAMETFKKTSHHSYLAHGI